MLIGTLLFAGMQVLTNADYGPDSDDATRGIVTEGHGTAGNEITTGGDTVRAAQLGQLIAIEAGNRERKIVAGSGWTTEEEYNQNAPNWFLKHTPMKPGVLGGKIQAHAFNAFDQKKLNAQKVEKLENPAQFIVDYFKDCTEENKGIYMCEAPLLDFPQALDLDSTLAKRVKLYIMGGQPDKGYNANVNLQNYVDVITKHVPQGLEVVILPSQTTEKHNLGFTPEDFENFKTILNPIEIGKSLIEDTKKAKGLENIASETGIRVNKSFALNDLVLEFYKEYPQHCETQYVKHDWKCLDENNKLKPEYANQSYKYTKEDHPYAYTIEKTEENTGVKAIYEVDRNKFMDWVFKGAEKYVAKVLAYQKEKESSTSTDSSSSSSSSSPSNTES